MYFQQKIPCTKERMLNFQIGTISFQKWWKNVFITTHGN